MEATMVCLDNSEWSRNGDFVPTRFGAQTDATSLICGAKMQVHPESGAGVLSMAGDRVEVFVTPTKVLGQIVACLEKVRIGGSSDIVRGIHTAQIALKHRQNKTQRQRIICFVASPVEVTEKVLEGVGKNLKKNNVAIDVISFGELEANAEKLKKLVNAANSNDNCHLLEVPKGHTLCDAVLASAIVITAASPTNDLRVPGPAATADNPFGVDPQADPELYLALRMSLEEEEARQQKTAVEGSKDVPAQSAQSASAQAVASTPQALDAGSVALDEGLENMQFTTVEQINAMTGLDDEVRQALILSLSENANEGETDKDKDDELVSSLLMSLPGVNVENAREVLESLREEDKEDKKEDKKDEPMDEEKK